tara:strand:- start:5768 stop:6433 length:666 start_codon:yes stop_codon:yes gene_type:complete
MLKPKKKITRKEIKRDPFLETVDKLENSFEQNKKTLMNIVLFLIAGGFIISFLLKKQEQKNTDSNSALGMAMVAFENKDYENAKFQFESIISEFDGTVAFSTANFYLGRIYFENNEFIKSEASLSMYMNSIDSQIFLMGAIKMLAHISLQNNQYDKAIKFLDSGSKRLSKNDSIELKLMKILVLKEQNKIDKANILLDEIISEQKLPRHLKQKSEEIIGMM